MTRFLIVLALLPLVVASPSWPAGVTQSMLAQPGYAQHEFVTRSRHPGKNYGSLDTAGEYAYWAVNAPYDASAQGANDPSRYTAGAFCIDIEHTLNRNPYNSTWANMADIDDLIGALHTIQNDEADYDAACGAAFTTDRQAIMDQTLVTPFSLANQLSSTASWCDVMRIVKYRGALMWLMNNRAEYQGKVPSDSAVAQQYGCPATTVLDYGHTQRAVWKLVENKESGNGIPASTTHRQQCQNYLVHLALQNNAYLPSCPSGSGQPTYRVNVPLVIKPNLCTDGVTGGCRQYLLMDNYYDIPCGGSDDEGSPASLSGVVYRDADCNSEKGEEEESLAGIPISACPCENAADNFLGCHFTTTDEENGYSFADLDASKCWRITEDSYDGVTPPVLGPIAQPGQCNSNPAGEVDAEWPGSITGVTMDASATCLGFNFAHCPAPECPTCLAENTHNAPVTNGQTYSASTTGSSVTLCFQDTTTP